MSTKKDITLTINGRTHSVSVDARRTLADVIRDDCHQTGTHLGCEHGVCGACTIILDGEPVRSCLMFGVQADGKEIRTVEGLAKGNELHPLQQAFMDHHALQCGFCTPGFLLTVYELLEDSPEPSEDEIMDALSGQICRCTGYQPILAAVRLAAAKLQKARETGAVQQAQA